MRSLLIGLVATLLGADFGVAETVQSRDSLPGVRLTSQGRFAWIEDRTGGVVELEIDPGTHLTRIRELEGGWIAGGTRRTEMGRELVIVLGEATGARGLPPPPSEGSRLRFSSVPLVDAGRFVGLAWLEGDHHRRLAVRAASWDGAQWGAAETISPPAGEQVALQAAVLADGSRLLVWTAHDGGDDEITWSRRTRSGWSLPALVHEPNDVPDVRPTVLEAGRGALLAWQWFDGSDYRLKLATFAGGLWTEKEYLGPPGSIQPSLHARPEGAVVLYRSVKEESWSLLSLDEVGAVRARASAPGTTLGRPLVDESAGEGLTLLWRGRAGEGKDVRVRPGWEPRR